MIKSLPWAVGFWGLLVSLASASLEAHPTHTSFTEATWNAESNCLEFTMRVESDHFEDAVRRHANKRVKLEDEDVEAYVQDYLAATFQFFGPAGKPIEFQWIGFEVNVREVWVYFELKLPVEWERIEITNRILFGEVREQTNIVSYIDEKPRQTLAFTPAQPTRTLHRQGEAAALKSSP